MTLVGFSLSGNTVLKLLGEAPDAVPANVVKAAAICPAVNLGLCARSLSGPFQRVYDRHFVRLCAGRCESIGARGPIFPVADPRRLKTLVDFDDAYTGPVCGFGSADNYYTTNSAGRHIENIRLPTLIVAAEDDPLVPVGCFAGLLPPPHVLLVITRHGGHLGYIAKSGSDPDRRWMDWRIVDWVTAGPASRGSEENGDASPLTASPLTCR